MTNIPEARRILEAALDCDTPHEHIREALALMTRTVRNKPRQSGHVPMTTELGDKARWYHRFTPLTNAEIGHRLNVDGGRVSEALNGMWT